MTAKSKFMSAVVGAAMVLSMASCASTARVECDVDDQIEFDSDCGYYQDGSFVWHSWVVQGKTSYSPEGWEKPAQANHDEESGTYSKPKKAKSTRRS